LPRPLATALKPQRGQEQKKAQSEAILEKRYQLCFQRAAAAA
jgi:hypothetical protein